MRGFELGGVNSSLLAVILKRKLMKWESLALGYTADIVMLTHTFVVDVVCPVETSSSWCNVSAHGSLDRTVQVGSLSPACT